MHASVILAALLGLTACASPINPITNPIVSLDGSIPEDVQPSGLKTRQSTSDTRNDLVNGVCKNVTVIFARGTAETGNVGTLVGPPLFNNLGAIIGNNNVAVQGVDYPADVAGFLAGGSDQGGATLATLAQQAATQCPNTQIVLGGYSQGAQVVYKGAAALSAAVAARVNAVVLFGNPNDGTAVPNIPASKVMTYCHTGDLICAHTAIITAQHLTYAADTPAAAEFIAERVTV